MERLEDGRDGAQAVGLEALRVGKVRRKRFLEGEATGSGSCVRLLASSTSNCRAHARGTVRRVGSSDAPERVELFDRELVALLGRIGFLACLLETLLDVLRADDS